MLVAVALTFTWPLIPQAAAQHDGGPPSRLEAFYTDRTSEAVRQYGYRLFDGLPLADVEPAGAVPDDYVLGVGDHLSVVLRGGRDLNLAVAVDGSGRVVLPELPPIAAAGRTLAEFRAATEGVVAARLGATDVYLTLEQARQIAVLLVGEVPRPGRYRLSAFATVLDALAAAGGVERHGSLRAIRLVRDGAESPVDLYALMQGDPTAPEMALRDNDRVVVPPLGATVAVVGDVRRPAVYELAPGHSEVAVPAALALAGGPLQPGPAALLRRTIGEDGIDRTVPIHSLDAEILDDGDVLRVAPRLAAADGQVTLVGHVTAPGPYALADTPTMMTLIGNGDRLGDTSYLPFAALERRDRASGARVLSAVDLTAVLSGQADPPLADGDRMIVLSVADIAFLASDPVLTLLRGEPLRVDDLARCAGLAALARAVGPENGRRSEDDRLTEAARRLTPVPAACPDAINRFPDLLPLAIEHAVVVWRGVSRPGLYPTASAAALSDLVALAGGESGTAARVVERPGAQAAYPGETVAATPPQVALVGPVVLPGWRDLAATPSLARLLGDGDSVQPEIYPLFGIVVRHDAGRLAERILPFSPTAIVTGDTDLSLQDGDWVRVFSSAEVERALGTAPSGGLAEVTPVTLPATSGTARPNRGVGALDDRRLAGLLADHTVDVSGAVARPGAYPVAGPTTLARIIEAAGGITRQADQTAVEVIREHADDAMPTTARFIVDLTWQRPETLYLTPGDAILVPPRYMPLVAAAVTIRGEVLRPGTYALVRGERLSDLIARAGGLTPHAFPGGAIFTRAAARARETADYRRLADQLDRELAARLLDPEPPTTGEVDLARRLVTELRTVDPAGRVVVEADPEILDLHPERDPLLAPGDVLHMPARSLSVRVSGEVLSPAALPFRTGMDADAYIRAAGGVTHFADRDRIFVLLPDGSAEPVAESLWSFTPVAIPPGATIIVPRDPEPFDFLALTGSLAGVLSQIAITAASISVISD